MTEEEFLMFIDIFLEDYHYEPIDSHTISRMNYMLEKNYTGINVSNDSSKKLLIFRYKAAQNLDMIASGKY